MAASVSLRVWVLLWLLGAFAHWMWRRRRRRQRQRRWRWIRNLYMTIYVDVGIFNVYSILLLYVSLSLFTEYDDTHTSSLLHFRCLGRAQLKWHETASYTLLSQLSKSTHRTLNTAYWTMHRMSTECSVQCVQCRCSSVLHFFYALGKIFEPEKRRFLRNQHRIQTQR